jgi:hypothetical protein
VEEGGDGFEIAVAELEFFGFEEWIPVRGKGLPVRTDEYSTHAHGSRGRRGRDQATS